MEFIYYFLLSLLVTELLEFPVVLLFYTLIIKKKPNFQVIFTALLTSVLTIPYIWFVLPDLITFGNYILIGEIIVIIVEAIIYYVYLRIPISKSLILSLIANAISYFIGLQIISLIMNFK